MAYMNTSFFKKPWVIIAAIAIVVAIWGVARYNSFASLDQKTSGAFATIDTQLQRRYDLIPNLVNTVKGNTEQEKAVFTALAEARTKYGSAQTQGEKVAASNQVESALSRLLVIAENYPDLKSSQAFRDLMAQLEGTENRIAVARKDYNDAVQEFNTARMRFPGNIIGSIFGFDAKEYFRADAAAATAPAVNFQ